MKKALLVLGLLASFAVPPSAMAQAGCMAIPSGLSIGSKGSAVSNLQSFLVAQNYPGEGSWMITGNFGQATAAAVRDYQAAHGLPQTGWVDASTAMMMSGGCSGSTYNAVLSLVNPSTYTTYSSSWYPSNAYYNYSYPTAQSWTYPSSTYSYPGYPGYSNGYTNYQYPYNYSYPYNYGNYNYGNQYQYPYNYNNGNYYNNGCNSYPYNTYMGYNNGCGQLQISSVSGPNNLGVGQSGTWTVLVNGPSYQNLTFGVDWGDSGYYQNAPYVSQQQTTYQTNTLTHAYYNPGTYTIRFWVSGNGSAQSTYYTTTVVVGGVAPGYNNGTSYVSIANMAFSPSSVTITRGSTLTWTNNDSTSHTVTSDNNLFSSGTINPGQIYSYTFNTPGTYYYHCSIHPSMTGVIYVQ